MKQYVLFGAGQCAKEAIILLGQENIAYIIDNDESKVGETFENLSIYSFETKRSELCYYTVVVSVLENCINEICNQLETNKIRTYILLGQIKSKITKEKLEKRINYIDIYNKAITWIKMNSIDGHAIICNSRNKKKYPEVTGYYIPTLIRWGYRELAIEYANWLVSVQKESGSWYDTEDHAPYIFDTAQILKGLLAVYDIHPRKDTIKSAIINGCEWIFSCMTKEGRLVTPNTECWGGDEDVCSELIHLYCLSPLIEAGKRFTNNSYMEKSRKIFEYYKNNYYERIMNFSLLSHFYAYVMEALVDLGEIELVKEAMSRIASYQKPSGAVPAYNNVDWVCSTGLFQLSLVWFRLREIERGNKAFEYACKLQNESGGWYGSYLSEINPNEMNDYFPYAEISWANKYFLDALYYKKKAEFNQWSDSLFDLISLGDERYCVVKNEVEKADADSCILDVGCGKGRYLKNLISDVKDRKYFGVDLSESILENIEDLKVSCKEGTLTCIPYENDKFSVVYTCEALGYAVDVESAVREMCRVTKQEGTIVIIDKNDSCYGELEIAGWGQCINEELLKNIMLQYCSNVQVRHGLKYEDMKNKDLFSAWIGCVK